MMKGRVEKKEELLQELKEQVALHGRLGSPTPHRREGLWSMVYGLWSMVYGLWLHKLDEYRWQQSSRRGGEGRKLLSPEAGRPMRLQRMAGPSRRCPCSPSR